MKIMFETPTKMLAVENHKYSGYVAPLIPLFMGLVIFYVFMFPPRGWTVTGDPRLGTAGGLFFAIIGILLILFNKHTMLLIDKNSGKCSIASWSMIKKEKEEFDIASIKGMNLKINSWSTRSSPSEGHRAVTNTYFDYILSFNLKGGAGPSFAMGRNKKSPNDDETIKEAHQMADFLGIQLKVQQAPLPTAPVVKPQTRLGAIVTNTITRIFIVLFGGLLFIFGLVMALDGWRKAQIQFDMASALMLFFGAVIIICASYFLLRARPANKIPPAAGKA